MQIPRNMVEAVAMFVSKDETRQNLSGIRVERQADGAAALIATDGHRLGRFSFKEDPARPCGVDVIMRGKPEDCLPIELRSNDGDGNEAMCLIMPMRRG